MPPVSHPSWLKYSPGCPDLCDALEATGMKHKVFATRLGHGRPEEGRTRLLVVHGAAPYPAAGRSSLTCLCASTPVCEACVAVHRGRERRSRESL